MSSTSLKLATYAVWVAGSTAIAVGRSATVTFDGDRRQPPGWNALQALVSTIATVFGPEVT